jgi:transcription antitermination factor NusG
MKNVPQRELTQSQRNSPLPIRRPRKTALFPRYAFVRFDMGKSGWREIFRFSGVAGMICAGQLPIAVPDEWIEAMRAQEVDGIVPGKIPAKKVLSFQAGDTARVIEGPFTGFNVVVDSDLEVNIEDLDSGMRIRVLVSMLGQMVKTHLEIAQLESV